MKKKPIFFFFFLCLYRIATTIWTMTLSIVSLRVDVQQQGLQADKKAMLL